MSDDALDQARRSAALYRALLIGVVLLGAGAAVVAVQARRQAAHRFGPPDATWVVDLPSRKAYVDERQPGATDLGEVYVGRDDLVAEMHFMGEGQRCPWHLHPISDELTVTVAGTVDAMWRYGDGGAVALGQATLPPHHLGASAASSLHQYVTHGDVDGYTPVFVVSTPRHGGNLYVAPDDPRALEGDAPDHRDPGSVLEGLDGVRIERLQALSGDAYAVGVASGWTLPAAADGPVLAYVAAGEGTVAGLDVRPGVLVHVAGSDADVVATSPMALWVVDLFGAIEGSGATIR